MKRLLELLLAVLMTFAIAMVPGCGARKAAVDTSKTKTVNDSKTDERSITVEQSKSSSTASDIDQKAKVNEEVITTTTTRYDKDTGKKTEETTKTETKKKTDNSKKTSNRTFDETHYRMIDLKRTITTHVLVKTYEKHKVTDANNNALYWMLGCVLAIAIVCYVGYLLLKSKVKP